jgi:hypothetical protein
VLQEEGKVDSVFQCNSNEGQRPYWLYRPKVGQYPEISVEVRSCRREHVRRWMDRVFPCTPNKTLDGENRMLSENSSYSPLTFVIGFLNR